MRFVVPGHHNPHCCRAPVRGGKDRLRFAMSADLDKYRPYLDGFDMTEEEKAAFIHSLWTVMEAFADCAFGLHPVQQIPGCRVRRDSNGREDGVDSKEHSPRNHFKRAAGSSGRQEGIDHEEG